MNKEILKTDFQSLYNALLRRDDAYEGLAFVCVKTTGIFCRLSCAARKPLESNIEFVASIIEAKNKGYRACLRCKPETSKKPLSLLTARMIEELHKNPQKRWDSDAIRVLGIDESTLRRSFQRDFGTTFLKFAREHRLGAIVSDLENGGKIIEAQLDAGYDSSSGFVEAVKKQIGTSPKGIKFQRILSAKWLETPIGPMLGVADDEGLHLLEFAERKGLPKEIETTKKRIGAIVFRNHQLLETTEIQLKEYFQGTRQKFNIPIAQFGTPFEKSVWAQLQTIPFGTTRSYAAQAKAIENPNAVRAVARANGSNKVAIIVPCHRVIGSDGSMTGYAGKIWRKEWLLTHERKFMPSQEQS